MKGARPVFLGRMLFGNIRKVKPLLANGVGQELYYVLVNVRLF